MADNSILISKYIQTILEESKEVKDILGYDQKKIFTLIYPDNITYPYIVHSRTGLSVSYTKDIQYANAGWVNTINYTIKCVSNDYIQGLYLANAVRHSMETYRWNTEDIYIHPIKLLSVSEYPVAEDEFVQELQFQMMIE